MRQFIRERYIEVIFTVISFCICFLFFHLVTDDYASFYSSLADGQFSDFPFCIHYWMYLGLSSIYSILYQRWPEYDWLELSITIFEFISLYLILRLIKNKILTHVRDTSLVRAFQILFIPFFIENIVYITNTRAALLFCGIALINLLFSDKISRKDTLINSSLFVFGMMLRPEGSLGMLLLVSTGYLIYKFDLIHLTKRILLPVAAAALLFTAYFVDWTHTDQIVKKLEPEVEYKLMDKRVVSLSTMHTATDSVKLEAAAAGLCFDPKRLTADYFRSIQLQGPNLNAEHARIRLLHILSLYKHYPFILLYAISLMLLSWYWLGKRKLLFQLLIFRAATFLIIYSLDFTGGLVSGRHFLNLQLISLLIISFYFFRSIERPLLKVPYPLLFICLICVGIGVVLTTARIKKSSDMLTAEMECYENTMQEIENLYNNRIIILTTDHFHLFDHPFRIKNRKYTRNTYLMYDVFSYWLFPEYVDYIRRQCHCDPLDPAVFYKWLSSQKALYIAESWRYDLTSKYMGVIHQQQLQFVPLEEYQKPSCMKGQNLEKFELREVIVK